MTDLNLTQLQQIALRAPQGDWRQTDWDRLIRNSGDDWTPLARCEEPRTAAHIAAFDPPTVLSLIARVEQAEHRAKRYKAQAETRLETIQRVRDLHWETLGECAACSLDTSTPYPCPTIQALEGDPK